MFILGVRNYNVDNLFLLDLLITFDCNVNLWLNYINKNNDLYAYLIQTVLIFSINL